MKIRPAELLLIRYFWYVTIVLMAVVVFGGYNLLVKPKLALLQAGGLLDVQSYENILLQEKQYLNRVTILDQEYKKLDAARLEKLAYVIADKLDVPGLLYVFESLDTQHGIIPDNFTYESNKGVTKVKISFKEKDYYQFKDYLKTLEDSVRIMDITNVQMSVRQSDYTIELSTYYLEQGSPASTIQPAQTPAATAPKTPKEKDLEKLLEE